MIGGQRVNNVSVIEKRRLSVKAQVAAALTALAAAVALPQVFHLVMRMVCRHGK